MVKGGGITSHFCFTDQSPVGDAGRMIHQQWGHCGYVPGGGSLTEIGTGIAQSMFFLDRPGQ